MRPVDCQSMSRRVRFPLVPLLGGMVKPGVDARLSRERSRVQIPSPPLNFGLGAKVAKRIPNPQDGVRFLTSPPMEGIGAVVRRRIRNPVVVSSAGVRLLCPPPRGCSSVGRARHWQCRGQGFETPHLHHGGIAQSGRAALSHGASAGVQIPLSLPRGYRPIWEDTCLASRRPGFESP